MRCAPCNLLVLSTHRLLPTTRLLQAAPSAPQVTGTIHRFVRFVRRRSNPHFLQSRQFAWRPRSLPAVANPFDAHSTVLVQSPAVRSNSSPTTATANSPPPLRPNPSQSDYNSAHIRPRETTHFRRQTQAADQGGNQWSPLGNDKQHQS